MVRAWRRIIGASIGSLGSLMVGLRSEESPDRPTGEEGTLIEFVSSVPAYTAVGVNTAPPMGSLWRSSRNVIRLTFSADLPSIPLPGQILIQELGICCQDCPPFGADLSAGFTFTVESGDTLRIGENGTTFGHRKWYGVRNIGDWAGVSEFEIHFPVQVGDASGDNRVLGVDPLLINSGVPCIRGCGDQNRLDIDGDGRVLNADVLQATSRMTSMPVAKPCGH